MQHYPESPELKAELTKLPGTYYFKAILAVLSVILFFVLYSLLVYGLIQLCIMAISYPMGYVNKLTILGKLGAVAGSIMLLIFALKFIFKLKNHKPNNRIQLSKEEYPKLWEFILKICEETSAPKPKYIYVDPDVNAYVRYTNTWLSLFFPVKKELTIGLGLVSTLNLSEFKAVMSHEFGHFSQKSMTIGSYIMSANTIIHDMIFSRDKWDDTLENWKRQDVRVSFIAWLLMPIIWLIRQFLNLFYQLLNLMYSLLSREMEFNADKVAVQTSGSDSIVSGLWKLEKGFENWNNNMNNLYYASQSQKYIDNIYTHLNYSWDNLQPQFNNEKKELPKHQSGGLHFFSSKEETKVNMYASHPPNNLREKNAKSPYIECKINDNSPWCLFENEVELQKKMTSLIYKIYFGKVPSANISFDDFQNFIELEKGNTEIFKEYHNALEVRFLNIPTLSEIKEKAIIIGINDKLYFDNLKNEIRLKISPIKEYQKILDQVNEWYNGSVKLKHIEFKEKKYKKKELQSLYSNVQSEMDKLYKDEFTEWDLNFFSSHYAISKSVGKENDYVKIITQQDNLEKFNKNILFCQSKIIDKINLLQSKEEVSEYDLSSTQKDIITLFTNLNDIFEDNFNSEDFFVLPNIGNLEELKQSIVEGGTYEKITGDIFKNGGLDTIMNTLEHSSGLCNRINQKNLEQLLLFNRALLKA